MRASGELSRRPDRASLLCFRTWRARGRPAVISLFPRNRMQVARATVLATIAIYVMWHRFGQ